MADLDFEAPTFSLGLDLDFDSELPSSPIKDTHPNSARISSTPSISPEFPIPVEEDDEDFQLHETPDPHPPPAFKRLRRRPKSPPSFSLLDDDEIEDFSSQEDQKIDEHPFVLNPSACSTSKRSLHGQRILTKSSSNKLKSQKSTPTSSSSTFTNLEGSSSRGALPKITFSPPRKIQLLDSDSDDQRHHDQPEYLNKCGMGTKGKNSSLTQGVLSNQHNTAKRASHMLQSETLWKDLNPRESINLATPAFDEFCEEYVVSMKDKNVDKGRKGNSGNVGSSSAANDQFLDKTKACHKGKNIYGNGEIGLSQHVAVPPAYHYYYHNDPRIQKLVRDRLRNFFPINAVKCEGNEYYDAASIDYMSQFGQCDVPTQVHATRKRGNEGNPQPKKRSRSNANEHRSSQSSEGWVNPRTSISATPKNAGKRRVCADVHTASAGHWYTAQDGRKVYVNKSGQELTGQAAYRHYKKESGGFQRKSRKVSSKKVSPKKKSSKVSPKKSKR